MSHGRSHSGAAQNYFVRPSLEFGLQNVTVDELWENNKQSKTLVLTFGGQAGLRGLAWWEKGAKIVVGTRIRRTVETEPETPRTEAQESLA